MKFILLLHRELTRPLMLAGLVAILLLLDHWLPGITGHAELSPLLTSTAMVVGVALVSQLTRRVLFPRLDLQHVAELAVQTPIGAALVFVGTCVMLSTLLYANVAMLR